MEKLFDAIPCQSITPPTNRELNYPILSPEFIDTIPFVEYGLESESFSSPFTFPSVGLSDGTTFSSPAPSLTDGYQQSYEAGGPRDVEYGDVTRYTHDPGAYRNNVTLPGPASQSPSLVPQLHDARYPTETSQVDTSQRLLLTMVPSPEADTYPRYFVDSTRNAKYNYSLPSAPIGVNGTSDKFHCDIDPMGPQPEYCPRECSPTQICSHRTRTHALSHIKSTRLQCTCGKQFNSRSAAKRHCETQIPAFKCFVCHRYFTRQYNRNAHQIKCASRIQLREYSAHSEPRLDPGIMMRTY